MKRVTARTVCGLRLALAAAAFAALAQAAQHQLDFDELIEGRVFTWTNQAYEAAGIRIYGTCDHTIREFGTYEASTPTVFNPTTGTVTEPFALINELAYGSEFGSESQDMIIDLDGFTSHWVRVFVGLAETAVGGDVTATLEGYRKVELARGTAYVKVAEASRMIGHWAVSPGLPRELVLDRPEGDIGLLRVTYGNSFAREVIDNMIIRVFEGAPPPPIEDTAAPFLRISEPANYADVPYSTVYVTGTITEDLGLENVYALAGGELFPLTWSGIAPDFFFGGMVTLPSATGTYSIRVLAYDLVGNLGDDTHYVDYEYTPPPEPEPPPPPNLDFEADGMEAVQSIQGWGMSGTTEPEPIGHICDLIAGKKTLVRVYARALGTDVAIEDVNCVLHAYRGATEIEGSPIYADARITIEPGEDRYAQRPDLTKSFNFVLPPEWTAEGAVSLHATVNPWNGVREREGHFDALNDAVIDVTFQDSEELCLIVHPIRSTSFGNVQPTFNEINDNLILTRQMAPVPEDKISLSVVGAFTTDLVTSNSDDDSSEDLLDDLRRHLGLYYGLATAYPCTNTVYLGLTHNTVGLLPMTSWERPVCVSQASTTRYYLEATIHEAGHAFGLGHVQGCDDPADPYEDYPTYHDYEGDNYPTASIGDWGLEWDVNGDPILRDPEDYRDIMSYCDTPWMSIYTHRWLTDHFGVAKGVKGDALPQAKGAEGEKGDIPYFRINGRIRPISGLALDPAWQALLPEGTDDLPGKGVNFIRLYNQAGTVLFERRFNAGKVIDGEDCWTVDQTLPVYKGVVRIDVGGNDVGLTRTIRAGVTAPVVTLSDPLGDATWEATGKETIAWKAVDRDEDALLFAVFFSNNNGATWTVVADRLSKPACSVDLAGLPGGEGTCLVRVQATDGINQGAAVSELFTKRGQAPRVAVSTPKPVALYPYGATVIFQGAVSDIDGEKIPRERITWTSSVDGVLGNGVFVGSKQLRPGLHCVRLEAVDGTGLTATALTAVYVMPPRDSSVVLPKTGQKTCTNEAGGAVGCAGTGQDGEIRAGVAWPTPRFAVGAGGTLKDGLTGLAWAPNAGTPAVGQLPAGPMHWEQALIYVDYLNMIGFLGQRDWRLPNANELLSILDMGASDQEAWLVSCGFRNISATSYWTSTTTADNTKAAWHVNLTTAAMGGSPKDTAALMVLPVRGMHGGLDVPAVPADLWKTGQTVSYYDRDDGDLERGVFWPTPRFVDQGNGTVTDRLTGLMWLKDASCMNSVTWLGAFAAVEELNSAPELVKCREYYAGYTDWRVPNAKELQSLIDFSQSAPALMEGHPFQDSTGHRYWSSTTCARVPSTAWTLEAAVGALTGAKKTELLFVWPVRGGTGTAAGETSHLVVTKTGQPSTVSTGGHVTYTVKVANYGPDDARGVALTDTYPKGTAFVSAHSTHGMCENQGTSAFCAIAALARGEEAVVTIVLKAPAEPGTITNRAEARCETNDPNLTDNGASASTKVVDVETFTLSVRCAGTGKGTVESEDGLVSCRDVCSVTYEKGTNVQLAAAADDGSVFRGWSGGPCTGTDPCSLVMDKDYAITATFNVLAGGFRRGDANVDGKVDIADAIAMLGYLFAQKHLQCLQAADANDDGKTQISDPIYLLGYLFAKTAPPPPPFPRCGPDPTADLLTCDSYTACN